MVREYVGSGLVGELAAADDAQERAEHQKQKEAWRAEQERIESAMTPLDAFCDAVEGLRAAEGVELL